jgi:drug/metabolite transporter (DMT)-like permease
MWWKGIPDFPWGKKEVRWLLVARGFSGFFGIYGMWYSMMYLPLADATVITFLAPGVAGILCYFALREPFTKSERIATAVALLGVILIARPVSLFMALISPKDQVVDAPEQVDGGFPSLEHEPTAEERLLAVGVALLGVLGAAGAFTSIRTIGKRAHPLISVNFFGMACTIICVLTLILAPTLNISQPHLRWITPKSWKGWFLLLWIAVPGFIMQYLLTSGLAADKSNRANAMIYTHMLFAVSFDRWIFGQSMSMTSLAGCALILGSAITVVLTKNPPAPKANDIETQGNLEGEVEVSPMLVDIGGHVEGINLRRT